MDRFMGLEAQLLLMDYSAAVSRFRVSMMMRFEDIYIDFDPAIHVISHVR